MKQALLLICLLLSIAPAYSAFEVRSITVHVVVDEKGYANVEETIELFLTSRDSVELYESTLSINDLGTWGERIGHGDIRHHFDRALVQFMDFRIRPQPISRCTSIGEQRSNCYAKLIFDYTILPFSDNETDRPSTGLFTAVKFKPRTTRFILNRNAFSFEVNQEGDVVLPKNTELIITIPQDAKNIYIQPLPQNLGGADTIPKELKTFSWKGIILPKLEFIYEREGSLESEVLEFFGSTTSSVTSLLNTTEGMAVLVIAIIFISAFVYINVIKKK